MRRASSALYLVLARLLFDRTQLGYLPQAFFFGKDHVGFVVKFPRGVNEYSTYFAEAMAPDALLAALHDPRPQRTSIHPSSSWPSWPPTSSRLDIARLAHSFQLWPAFQDISVWTKWVPSNLNIGDAPSRPDRDDSGLVSDYGAIRVPLDLDLDLFLGVLNSHSPVSSSSSSRPQLSGCWSALPSPFFFSTSFKFDIDLTGDFLDPRSSPL